MIRAVERSEVLGCIFDKVTAAEVLDLILDWRSNPERQTHTIVTVNVAILMLMRADPSLAKAVGNADLVVPDGTPIVWASRWLQARLPERVTGIDLMLRLLEEGAKRKLRIFLLGTTESRLRRVLEVIEQRYRGVEVVGARNGYFGASDYPDVLRQIRESRPDILFVGMPAPFKEVWCEEYRSDLQVPAVLGVGGAFDVIAGYVPRAPKVMQDAGLEWLWRLSMEPRKLWKRYLATNSRFLAIMARELVQKRLNRA